MNTLPIYTVSAVTVLWKDLGFDPNKNEHHWIIQGKWNEIADWLEDNCERVYNIKRDGVWFLDPQDAVLFKLVWAGVSLT